MMSHHLIQAFAKHEKNLSSCLFANIVESRGGEDDDDSENTSLLIGVELFRKRRHAVFS